MPRKREAYPLGSRDQMVEWVGCVLDDLRLTMGLEAEPLFTKVYRWPLGIGQYRVGHLDRVDRIHEILAKRPGLWMAGSSFFGISMNACVEKAGVQAREILGFLRYSPSRTPRRVFPDPGLGSGTGLLSNHQCNLAPPFSVLPSIHHGQLSMGRAA